MPVFVIQTLGRPTQLLTVDRTEVRVGRSPENQIVLPQETVSREHAVFLLGPLGRWQVSCVSETNPVVVDGRLVTQGANVQEGSEVLIGSEHLVVFFLDPQAAEARVGASAGFERRECSTCHWRGLMSSARKNLTCPRCGGVSFLAVERYDAAAADPGKARVSTTALDPEAAKGVFRELHAPRAGFLERADERAGPDARVALRGNEPLTLGSPEAPALKLYGVTFGKVHVTWKGKECELLSEMIFPAATLNGARVKTAVLQSGEVFEVGSNRFRFVAL